MKISSFLAAFLAGSCFVSSVASSQAFPRVRNSATERMCADSTLFDSIAVGHLCAQYYSGGWGGGWGGRWGAGGWGPYSDSETVRRRDAINPDRQFDRVGRY